ncbi:hypothetical protein DEI99_008830 [Curtobacterium sp. MCLR17_036]|uniref:hypothetical protein n=1 Tax=Curtobacterium sp. MCLR17_036 TaxID=2175620 RepID=UPI000DA847F3|nr:hypothetical protein [Curtobacterium sp. MCLR17_036]WIE63379.1 hypothetical protein DEI99_008830 [Curtobacterium sp. MCLR17_036]
MSVKTTTRPPDLHPAPRRVSLADRLALRVGLALIIWSRRTRRVRPRLDPSTLLRLQRERQAREDRWLQQAAAPLRQWR